VVTDVDIAGDASAQVSEAGDADESDEDDDIPLSMAPSFESGRSNTSSKGGKRASKKTSSPPSNAKKRRVTTTTRAQKETLSTGGGAAEGGRRRESPRKGKGKGKATATATGAPGEHTDHTVVVGQKVQVVEDMMSVQPGESPQTTTETFVGTVIKVNKAKFQVKWDDPAECTTWYACGDESVTALPSLPVVPTSPSQPIVPSRLTRSQSKR
jgi:hypothetical protein